MLFNAGWADELWQRFRADPEETYRAAISAGWVVGDQAIIAHAFSGKVATWDQHDGILSFRDSELPHDDLPAHVRVVSFYDNYDPTSPKLRAEYQWIDRHWRC